MLKQVAFLGVLCSSLLACAPYSQVELERQASLMPHNYYVVRDGAVLCSNAGDAASPTCAGATPVAKNRLVWVLGYKPTAGVWTVRMPNNGAPMFIAASAVAKEPDPAAYTAFINELKVHMPVSQWVPQEAVNFSDLVSNANAYGARPIVFSLKRSELPKRRNKDGGMRFGLPIPATPDGRGEALVFIDLPNSDVVEGLMTNDYACDFDYCDTLMLITQVTGQTSEVLDSSGRPLVVPILRTTAVGDRYGKHLMAQ